MASKGPRSRLDHDTRAKRQKALEAPKEPRRPKTHWDHVLEEMVWLSKDFESERKWKLGQAKKVAVRASKCMLDQATKGERKVKEEEQRLRKLALNISKEMKRFWTKIEKLVLYKHQLELEERKKKALDKQLDFLLGQTERYSTMLAENLVDIHHSDERVPQGFRIDQPSQHDRMANPDTKHASEPQYNSAEVDKDYSVRSEDESEDDEHTIEEDEALVTEEERKEELTALQNEADLPLEELLQRYSNPIVSRDAIPVSAEGVADDKKGGDHIKDSISQENYSQCIDNHTNGVSAHVDKDDASHVMELDSLHGQEHKTSATDISGTHNNEELEGDNKSFGEKLTIKELQSRSHSKHLSSLDKDDLPLNSSDEMDDHDYILVADEEKDDETTLLEEEELAMKEANDPLDEIKLLQQDSEMPIEELIARYKKDAYSDDNGSEDQSDFASLDSDDQCSSPVDDDIQHGTPYISEDGDESNQHKSVELEQNHTKKEICMDIDKKLDEEIGTENIIADAAAAARSAQPTGNTFSTTKVRTKFPFLLKFPLREYQHIGLDWLVTMYEKRLNGILADEMGLGKTIMTISLLAHLACEKGIWGPHLIVVPTSVMLNWETEFLKWCPAFKILTYYGSAKERKHKRQGWLKPNSFHICITTYRLVIQDSKVFKRKKWKYLILDEAHLIKNWKSQRWQTLLNFNSKRRILLTGTPLQNDLMELWSLMHFLMPHIFQSHQEFKDWFSNPITGMVEGQEKVNKDVVDRLHNVLRPFILRRLKRDVEKQLPKKHEHVIYCRLSKRQRNLYEDFIASSETQATLASGNFFGMISVIMQLRKVCNHPDLFEGRPIISSFDMAGIDMQLSTSACSALSTAPFSNVDLKGLNIIFTQFDFDMTSWEIDEVREIYPLSSYFVDSGSVIRDGREPCSRIFDKRKIHGSSIFEEIQKDIFEERVRQAKERADAIAWWNSLRCQKKPVYGTNLRALLSIKHPVFDIHEQKNNPSLYMNFSSKLADVLLPVERFQRVLDLVECFMFAIPAARAPSPVCWCSKADLPVFLKPAYKEECTKAFCPLLMPIRPAIVRRQVYFPDRCLIQFDCGKLQELAVLLRRLKSEGHRALIFTQMTKMLDILEAFINLYGYTYMRLDGSTQPEERQTLMQRFNTNPKYFLFILSTRSGGVGINLVGADTVVFYDSDWNPAMDQQAQDRCHRIGQTREVHIYRLISESTIEENILKKANQKRALDDLVIQSGSYNTDFFKKLDPMELFSSHRTPHEEDQNADSSTVEGCNHGVAVLSHADVEAALKQAEDEADYMALKKVEEEEAVENQEFTEEAIGRLEDDDLVNDEDAKLDDVATEEQGFTSILSKDSGVSSHDTKICEDKPLTLTERDEDIDMLADVKQMAAAAAAAGQASSSFENQLRPVDRYAMRFLNLWDPIIDKSEIDSDLGSEEEEWELDRIQKFKDELEAEIDEDEEPLVYETWDADFATEAYKQHVEALAQQQLLEELESESLERDYADDGNTDAIRKEGPRERKTKKKSKKTKFKSLKKGSLTSEKEVAHDELKLDPDTDEYKILSLEDIPLDSPSTKKKRRIAAPEERASRKQLKKLKKPPECIPAVDSETPDKHLSEIKEFKSVDGMGDIDPKPASRSKMGGKISITVMPVKRVMVVKPEKFKKKGNIWSKECTPSPDSWSSQEDAILCAVVHEYGTHWSLVSNVLYGMPAGGFYRGRFRHPVHCCDRFRELFFRYILSSPESPNADKINAHSSGKALLKVTEDHVHMLLNTASELPDTELLLQKHFTALLSSVWRVKCRQERHQNVPCSRTASGIRSRRLTERMHPTVLRQSGKVVATALEDAFRDRIYQEESPIPSSQSVKSPEANVEVTLPKELVEFLSSFASVVRFSINSSDPLRSTDQPQEQDLLSRTSYRTAEQRFRLAWEACLEGESPGWASSAFPAPGSGRSRAGSKSQYLGKHKSLSDSAKPLKSKVPRITASEMEDSSLVNQFLSMAGCNFSDSGECLDPSFRLDASKDDDYQLLPVGTHIPMDYDVELLQYDHDPGVTVGLELASFDFEELEPLDDTMEFG